MAQILTGDAPDLSPRRRPWAGPATAGVRRRGERVGAFIPDAAPRVAGRCADRRVLRRQGHAACRGHRPRAASARLGRGGAGPRRRHRRAEGPRPRTGDPAAARLPRAGARVGFRSRRGPTSGTSSPGGAAPGRPARRRFCSRPITTRSARGPGAGDDASGVAAILESLRALKAGPPPDRDIIILINDGEEIGLFGAEVFAEEHPWAKDVGVVLNFDARGNTGPSFMFETSDGNGWLIEQMARALPHPMATSLTGEVYRLMPNDTDLTVYKKQGMAGLNFAFVGGPEVLSHARGHAGEPRPADAPAPGREPAGDGPAPGPARPRGCPPLGRDLSPRSSSDSWRSIRWAGSSRCWRLAAAMYLAVAALGLARRRIRLGRPRRRPRDASWSALAAVDLSWASSGWRSAA